MREHESARENTRERMREQESARENTRAHERTRETWGSRHRRVSHRRARVIERPMCRYQQGKETITRVLSYSRTFAHVLSHSLMFSLSCSERARSKETLAPPQRTKETLAPPQRTENEQQPPRATRRRWWCDVTSVSLTDRSSGMMWRFRCRRHPSIEPIDPIRLVR